jgi:hypothetical protein
MPSTIAAVFAAAEVQPAGVLRWGEDPAAPPTGGPSTGVYLVAVTRAMNRLADALPTPPIDLGAVRALLNVRPECRLDEDRPTVAALAARLRRFWYPDEVILYIGCAGPRKRHPPQGEMSKRVGEYYSTPLGARSPHAGGWFLKTLSNIAALHLHYAYCADVLTAERAMLGSFASNVSGGSRAALYDTERVMPFANLEFPKGVRKDHGVEKATEPRSGGPT